MAQEGLTVGTSPEEPEQTFDESNATSSTHANGLSTLDSFAEVHRNEIVRLMLQTLQMLGYRESLRKLEDESGVPLQSQHINQFRSSILAGQWDEVICLLPKLKINENSVKHVQFLVYQQKFMELLEAGQRKEALACLQTQLTPAAHDPAALHRLAGYVMCKDPKALFKRSGWDGKDGKSRQLLIKALHTYISSDQLLQESRLLHLLQQAQLLQRQQCPFHNTLAAEFSLLQDHSCSRSVVPQHTRCILRNHSDEVWFITFSHNGQYLATAGKDQRCLIFDVATFASLPPEGGTPTPMQCLQGHLDAISFVAWSPDDSLIVTCSQDCHCRVWNVQSGECVLKFIRHSEPVTSAAWFPDGQHVVSAALDKLMFKWDLTGKVKSKHSGARVNDISISQDATRMVTIDSEKRVITYNLRHPLDKLLEHEPSRGYSASSRERHDDSDDGLPDSEDEEAEARASTMHGIYKTIHKSTDSLTSLCLSHDGHFILVNKAINEKKGCIHLYDIRERPFKVVQKYTGHLQKRFVIRSCFGGAHQIFVLSGSEDHKVYIYHRATGKKLFALPGHQNVVNTVSWNPVRHEMFASGSDDGTVRVWMAPPAEF